MPRKCKAVCKASGFIDENKNIMLYRNKKVFILKCLFFLSK